MNPLLDCSGLPRFADFKPEQVTPAIDELLASARVLIARLVQPAVPATWEDFVAPLTDANEKLNRAWGQVGHLNAVMNSPELREVYNENLPKLTQYYTELGQHPDLFAKFKALKAAPDFSKLDREQRKVIDNELRDFRLGGAELSTQKKARFTAICERLSELSSRFSDNLLDATNAFAHYVVEPAHVTGIPDDVLQAARTAAEQDNKPGWKFTLHAPSYVPIMQYAENRELRELMYFAHATRASEFGKTQWDNTTLIEEIVALRRELAELLGFESYVDYSLATKMAESPQHVLDFLNELAARAKPFATRDLVELRQFARDQIGLSELQAWDIAYASEKLRVARYAFSDQDVKQYFPETTVLPGMFRLVETLYGIKIRPAEAPTWHPDVRFFAIYDGADNLIGRFYVDLYARPSKRGGAWMDEAITRRHTVSGVQTPVAYLNCNFSAPVSRDGKAAPALFTHDEVITLFHEFGHGLHHLLTQVNELGVSGIHGVEWDAVELPSQFMENFCWEWEVLVQMTRHVDTGATLPRALFEKLLAAKNFQSGMQTVRQIEFSLFDLHLHYDFVPAGAVSIAGLLDQIRNQVGVIIPPAFSRFAQSFSHIFAGGYAAGYYSYKWAEVLSADAYSLFEKNGVLDAATGARFRTEILAVGGSRPALESFVAFRGREPTIDALLRHQGMTAETGSSSYQRPAALC